MSQLTAKAVVGITADPVRPGQLAIELLRSADTVLVARPKITRRAVASDCLGAAGPYSVRGTCELGRLGTICCSSLSQDHAPRKCIQLPQGPYPVRVRQVCGAKANPQPQFRDLRSF